MSRFTTEELNSMVSSRPKQKDIVLDKIIKRLNYVPELTNKLTKEDVIIILTQAHYDEEDIQDIDYEQPGLYANILPVAYKYLNIDFSRK